MSTVGIGLLRFAGYGESRRIFEQRTGHRASEVSIGGDEVRKKLLDLAERHGIDTTGADLIWKDESKKDAATLDCFW